MSMLEDALRTLVRTKLQKIGRNFSQLSVLSVSLGVLKKKKSQAVG